MDIDAAADAMWMPMRIWMGIWIAGAATESVVGSKQVRKCERTAEILS